MIGWHVTTPNKLARYKATGCILPPVRFWAFRGSALAWARRTKRSVILRIAPATAYPMPDHRPRGHAHWTPEMVREWHVEPSVSPTGETSVEPQDEVRP